MLFFSWNKRKETRQERTTKKQGRKKSTRKQGRNKKNKKQDRERRRVKKEKWKKPRRKKGRHWDLNKITRFQGKNSVFIKNKKHKILKRVEGQQPQNTRAGFFCCPFGLLMVMYRLRIPCSLQKCHSSCFLLSVFCVSSFWWFLFRLLFPLLSFLCSLFLILLFMFLHFSLCDQKNRSNHRISEMFILMLCFGACILAFSLGPAKNPY